MFLEKTTPLNDSLVYEDAFTPLPAILFWRVLYRRRVFIREKRCQTYILLIILLIINGPYTSTRADKRTWGHIPQHRLVAHNVAEVSLNGLDLGVHHNAVVLQVEASHQVDDDVVGAATCWDLVWPANIQNVAEPGSFASASATAAATATATASGAVVSTVSHAVVTVVVVGAADAAVFVAPAVVVADHVGHFHLLEALRSLAIVVVIARLFVCLFFTLFRRLFFPFSQSASMCKFQSR